MRCDGMGWAGEGLGRKCGGIGSGFGWELCGGGGGMGLGKGVMWCRMVRVGRVGEGSGGL